MLLSLDDIEPSGVYSLMTQTLIPRPIAWVLSENADGKFNLAPFSYFNAVCSAPPLLMISVGKKPDGSFKDTRVNIEQRRDFVIHIPGRKQLEAMNLSAETLPANVSEVDKLALATVDFPGSRLPRLADCAVAYACRCYDIHEIGAAAQSLILGQITHVYLDDAVCQVRADQRIYVDSVLLDPVCRLSAGEYAFLGERTLLQRPK